MKFVCHSDWEQLPVSANALLACSKKQYILFPAMI
jgi:hypothetical protein